MKKLVLFGILLFTILNVNASTIVELDDSIIENIYCEGFDSIIHPRHKINLHSYMNYERGLQVSGHVCDNHIIFSDNHTDHIIDVSKYNFIKSDSAFSISYDYVVSNNKLQKGWRYHTTCKLTHISKKEFVEECNNCIKKHILQQSVKDITAIDENYKKHPIYNTFINNNVNGIIIDYDWELNYVNGIDVSLKYFNCSKNKKTIKYIDFYVKLTNDVGDICPVRLGANSARCVGPLKYGETSTWEFEAIGYTRGDATNLKFSKLVITYMDNTKVVLLNKNIKHMDNWCDMSKYDLF